MLLILYADGHIRRNGSFPPFNRIDTNGLTLELNNIIKGFSFVTDKIKEIKPDGVFYFGDHFHAIESIASQTLHASHLCLSMVQDECHRQGIKHYYLTGNHDLLSESKQIFSASIISKYFDKLYKDDDFLQIKDVNIGIVPFTSVQAKAYNSIISMAKDSDFIFTHLDFEGARYESGFCPPEEARLSPKIGKKVYSGHLHPTQFVDDVHFIGSLVQHRFTATHLKRAGGIVLLDTETMKMERFRNTYSKHYVKVNDLDQISSLDPKECVLQVISSSPREDVEKVCKDFDFHYMPKIEERENVHVNYDGINNLNPELMLRSFIETENSNALDDFDSVVGGEIRK